MVPKISQGEHFPWVSTPLGWILPLGEHFPWVSSSFGLTVPLGEHFPWVSTPLGWSNSYHKDFTADAEATILRKSMGYIQESRSCHGSPCQDNALGSERKEDMRIGQCKKHVSPEPHKENKVKRRKNKKMWRNGTSISLIISWISNQSSIIILTAYCHLSKFCLTNHSRNMK